MENDVKQTHHTNDNPASSKRKLLLGLAAAPVAATLPTRFAWGRGNECSISGLLSGNLSDQPTDYECRDRHGKSPGFWGTHPGCWPVGISFGTITATPKAGGTGIVISDGTCINSPFLSNNGKLTGSKVGGISYDYTYDGGTYLNALINAYSTTGTVSGMNNPIMDYLPTGDNGPSKLPGDLERHVASAMLTALHPSAHYPYTATEIANATIFAILNAKETQFTNILKALQDGTGTAGAAELVTRANC